MESDYYLRYLDYVVNTGGCTTDQFDEDWEPIGPQLRADLMPRYIEMADGKMVLTQAGRAAVGKEVAK